MTTRHCLSVLVLVAWPLALGACNKPGSSPKNMQQNRVAAVRPPALSDNKPENLPSLPNVVAYADGLYSGGAPEGDEGFDTLNAMGTKTIISVDGAQPDVETAKKHGLRYVHLPIGYNGMNHERTLEIARAVRDLPGPTYIHCHHGKHRSAAATAATAVTLGYMTNAEATKRMEVSGTSPNYPGLYRCAAIATVASNQQLQAANNDFPEHWHTTGLVQTMVEVDEVFDHLKAIRAADWKTPAKHPDLVPVAEAGHLADLFRDVRDDDEVMAAPPEFRAWLLEASHRADRLEVELDSARPSRETLAEDWEHLKMSCTDCHARYRN